MVCLFGAPRGCVRVPGACARWPTAVDPPPLAGFHSSCRSRLKASRPRPQGMLRYRCLHDPKSRSRKMGFPSRCVVTLTVPRHGAASAVGSGRFPDGALQQVERSPGLQSVAHHLQRGAQCSGWQEPYIRNSERSGPAVRPAGIAPGSLATRRAVSFRELSHVLTVASPCRKSGKSYYAMSFMRKKATRSSSFFVLALDNHRIVKQRWKVSGSLPWRCGGNIHTEGSVGIKAPRSPAQRALRMRRARTLLQG